MNGRIRTLMVLAAAAVAARLFALSFLHPLNWDEVEYFRATDWVRRGFVPFRDFWEHHTPLQWFVFAPFAALTDSPGADAILLMRWAQVPLWIAVFWVINRWMAGAGLQPVPRWAAMVLALTSSLLMISAMEYRVDVLANALYLAGLLLLCTRTSRSGSIAAGALFCLAGFANLRLGPLLAVTVILNRLVDVRERRWGGSARSNWVFAGVLAAFGAGLLYFVSTGSLEALYQYVWVDNYVGEKLADRVPFAFLHRLLLTFGVRIYGGPAFELSGLDLSGAAILLAGVAGMIRSARDWRAPGPLLFLALLQLANIAFIARMKFVYHYHLQIVVLLMLPFVASVLRNSRPIVGVVLIAATLHLPVVLLRGKELELRYQDLIMREVHARTSPGARVFDGVGWAIRREPAYRFWFLPVLARELVAHGYAAPLTVESFLRHPPAAVITDRNAAVWLVSYPQLGAYVFRHYLPLWRNLLVPGLSARIGSGETAEWIVPAGGRYRIVAAPALAGHSWFQKPLGLHRPADLETQVWSDVVFTVNGRPVQGAAINLAPGDRLSARNSGAPVGVFLVPGGERLWFRQPPPGVTIDAEGPRTWHLPRIGGGIRSAN